MTYRAKYRQQVRIGFLAPEELIAQLEAESKKQELSMCEVLRTALKEYLAQ